MSLSDPQRVPAEIRKLLIGMYAGSETGMSGPQILRFFRAYSDTIEEYPFERRGQWGPSRWMMFKDCLARFSLDQQKAIIQDLIRHPGPMKYASPDAGDVRKIQQWLSPDHPTDEVRVLETGKTPDVPEQKLATYWIASLVLMGLVIGFIIGAAVQAF
jgi:hypothetical protein